MSDAILVDGDVSLDIPVDGEAESVISIKGDPGFSPTVQISEITGGHSVSIIDIEGAHTFDIMDGAPGQKGDKGDKGDTGAKGEKGDNGNDYILTSSDKADIANLVLGELDSEEWVFTLEDDSTVTKQVVIMP